MTFDIMRRLKPSETLWLDVGAHTGTLAAAMRYYAPKAEIYCFEPLPPLAARVRRRFRNDTRVRVHEVALGDKSGRAPFCWVMSNPGYSGLVQRRLDRPREKVCSIEVECALLDDLVPPDRPVAFMKIDVEGGELGVLRGAAKTLRRWRPLVVFEHGLGGADYYGHRPEQVFDFFADIGMQISGMAAWLAGNKALGRQSFVDQFEHGVDWYFVAHSSANR